MRTVVFTVCAVILVLWFGYKVRFLRGQWQSPRLWVLSAAILFTALTVYLASPATVLAVDETSGMPNLTTLLIAVVQTLSGACYLVLALLWRYPGRQAAPTAWRILGACSVCIGVLIILFSVSSVPAERTKDFNTYYATQPTVAAFSLVWLAWVLAGHATLAYWCFTWARLPAYQPVPWLRRSLVLFGAYGLDVAAFPLVGIAAIIAHWFGTDTLDPAYKVTADIIAPGGALLLTAALALPKLGPRCEDASDWLRRWRTCLRLAGVHRRLSQVAPGLVHRSAGQRFDPYHRARRMVIELSDWRWTLAPLFDSRLAEHTRFLGVQAGLSGDHLAAAVEAAQLRAALRIHLAGGRAATDRHDAEEVRDGAFDTELTWWLSVAWAFGRSPVVARALGADLAAAPPQGGEQVPPRSA